MKNVNLRVSSGCSVSEVMKLLTGEGTGVGEGDGIVVGIKQSVTMLPELPVNILVVSTSSVMFQHNSRGV